LALRIGIPSGLDPENPVMWKVEARQTEPDADGCVEWEVELVCVNGRRELVGGGYYFIHNDPDGER
jgi:hypothetical protein